MKSQVGYKQIDKRAKRTAVKMLQLKIEKRYYVSFKGRFKPSQYHLYRDILQFQDPYLQAFQGWLQTLSPCS